MILLIDTNKREELQIGLSDGDVLQWNEIQTQDQSADILPKIEEILKKQKKSFKDIKAIVVNQGPGSFTGVRIGVTVANTLAWSLDIPVVGCREGKFKNTVAKIKSKNFSKIVLPSYE